MSSFVRQPIEKKLNRQNPISAIQKLERAVSKVVSIKSYDLANVAEEMVGVRIVVVDPNTGNVRIVQQGENLLDEFGINGYFATFNVSTGAATFWIDADTGALTALSGALVIDQRGIYATILSDIITQIADDGVTYRKGRLGMFTLQGATAPAFGMNYQDNAVVSELVTNGTFDTDLTGWTTVSELVQWQLVDGDGRAYLLGASAETKQIIATTAGVQYAYSVDGRRYSGTGTVKVTFDFHANADGSGALISSSSTPDCSNSWATYAGILTAPAGSASVIIRLVNISSGTGEGLFDNISFKVSAVSNYAGFDPTTGNFITKAVQIGGGAAIAKLDANTYTPTLYNTTNVAASTAHPSQWVRVGDTVTVCGRVDIDPTATGNIVLGMSLPVASDFGSGFECNGVAVTEAVAGQHLGVSTDSTNNRATFSGITTNASNLGYAFTFTYKIV